MSKSKSRSFNFQFHVHKIMKNLYTINPRKIQKYETVIFELQNTVFQKDRLSAKIAD